MEIGSGAGTTDDGDNGVGGDRAAGRAMMEWWGVWRW